MNEKILFIEASYGTGKNFKDTVAIAFDGLSIVDFIRQPRDYNAEMFMDWIKDEFNEYIIVIEPYGFGIAYLDYTDFDRESKFNRLDRSMAYIKYILNGLILNQINTHSCFTIKKQIDFSILVKQFDNFKIVQKSSNKIILTRIDREIDSSFAMCLLGWLAYRNNLHYN